MVSLIFSSSPIACLVVPILISTIVYDVTINMQEGDFEMKHIDKVGSSTFNVAIAPFSLSIIGDDDAGVLL